MLLYFYFHCSLLFSYICVLSRLLRQEVGVCLSVCKITPKVIPDCHEMSRKRPVKHCMLAISQIPGDLELWSGSLLSLCVTCFHIRSTLGKKKKKKDCPHLVSVTCAAASLFFRFLRSMSIFPSWLYECIDSNYLIPEQDFSPRGKFPEIYRGTLSKVPSPQMSQHLSFIFRYGCVLRL